MARRPCGEVRYDLAFRRFCRLPPGGAVPHHATFSKNRHSRLRDGEVCRLLLEATVRRCLAIGPVTARDAVIDASFVVADASWRRRTRDGGLADRLPGTPVPARPAQEWLADQAAAPAPDHGPRRGAPAALSQTDPAAAWSARMVRGRFDHALNLLADMPSGVAAGRDDLDLRRKHVLRHRPRLRTHNQNITRAARAQADKKTIGHRS